MFYRMQHNMVSFTPADHLVPVTAEDQVMAKCIKFLTLGPMSTSTLSFQQLYACGTLYLHLWSILIHFSPSKQPSVFITDSDSRDHRPQCVILGSSRVHFIGRWRWSSPHDVMSSFCTQEALLIYCHCHSLSKCQFTSNNELFTSIETINKYNTHKQCL